MTNPGMTTLLLLVAIAACSESSPAGGVAAAQGVEEAKIRQLIERVRGLDGATFIRNGTEHAAAAAAAHLEMKYRYAKGEIGSAAEFIAKIASRSSTTGEAYRIRLADGTETDAGTFFDAALREIENGERR